jgi:hypothetical protein
MHAGNRDRFLGRLALIKGYHPTAIHTNRDMVSLFTGDDTTATIDATVNIA